MGPNTYGFELSPGDDLGLDTTPDCCDQSMTATDGDDGYRDYTCGDCGTTLTVAPTGIVFDIKG
ncbi:hypothetical protein [Streptomyces sp. NPDC059604]|uniref:hypothetical protein n=1 Tax=Streptomyces sp. NPDC059604 TaxID=3346881 RepID=UPI003675D10D